MIDSNNKFQNLSDHCVGKQAETEHTETVTDDSIQPDSSADGMAMAQKTDLEDELNVISQSEVDDYAIEYEVISDDIRGKVTFSTITTIHPQFN